MVTLRNECMNNLAQWKILSENVFVGTLTEGWNLTEASPTDQEGWRTFDFGVVFSTPFDQVPVVTLALTGFDLDQQQSSRIHLYPAGITPAGFQAQVSTWRDTRVYSVSFTWLAIGS
jgi:hypothetical protein